MTLGLSGRRREPLHVLPMALALVLAAAVGSGFGVLWNALGFGN